MRHIEQKRVLVTGGAGFIGSHLCEDLLAHILISALLDLEGFGNILRSCLS